MHQKIRGSGNVGVQSVKMACAEVLIRRKVMRYGGANGGASE